MLTLEQILDEIVPALADNFEARNRHFREIKPASLEELNRFVNASQL
ncbi:MAG: hypothetical protein M3P45_10675 [Acidobacteriota bacterium]|nr:hypothetical protein [Acidobacteriota bacterium]